MNLLETGDADTSLCMLTIKFANVGRFFNSVKSSSKKRQQNLRSLRCRFNGKITVLLYTSRNVKKGEQLLYDYNEDKSLYPTDDFI